MSKYAGGTGTPQWVLTKRGQNVAAAVLLLCLLFGGWR